MPRGQAHKQNVVYLDGEIYSSVKRNEISEISQTPKGQVLWILFIRVSRVEESLRILRRGIAGAREGSPSMVRAVSVWGN